jgi:hypothetical protein
VRARASPGGEDQNVTGSEQDQFPPQGVDLDAGACDATGVAQRVPPGSRPAGPPRSSPTGWAVTHSGVLERHGIDGWGERPGAAAWPVGVQENGGYMDWPVELDSPADAEYREVIRLAVMVEWPAAGCGQGG